MELVIRFYLVLLFGGAAAQGRLILHFTFTGCLLIAISQWRQLYNTTILAGVNIRSDFQIEQFIDRVKLMRLQT